VTTQGRVLIVDDDAHVRDVVTAILELSGFEVTALCDGIDALDIRDDFQAILLDLQMPVFDGERLLDYWHMTNPALLQKVIVLTGYSRRRWNGPAKPYATIEKPVRHEEILRLVHECAARTQSQETGGLDPQT
jgi:CheY-like chemotaxis protein